MTSNERILSVSKLSKTVKSGDKTLTILHDIDLEVTRGESLAIVGTSGSGKTTLLSILAGLDSPSEGHIVLMGQNITSLNEDDRARIRRKTVGFIFQNFQLMPNLNALENVMLPLELQGHANPNEQAFSWLKKVGLAARVNHYPTQLSGGEQQRVAIARAFAIEPVLLFADEPTGNLDNQSAKNIIELLFNLNRQSKTTLIIVTHDDNLAVHCQRKLTLSDGTFQ